MTQHFARFCRCQQTDDVAKMSVALFNVSQTDAPFQVGDTLVAVPLGFRFGRACKITAVSEIRLFDALEPETLAGLGCTRDEFLASWRKTHGPPPTRYQHLIDEEAARKLANPVVVRVDFTPTEECVEVPKTAGEYIIEALAQTAAEEIAAQEDARVFADLDQIANG